MADVGFLTATETVTAVDANFTIDGVPITRTSNTISDLLDGVTLTLNTPLRQQRLFLALMTQTRPFLRSHYL